LAVFDPRINGVQPGNAPVSIPSPPPAVNPQELLYGLQVSQDYAIASENMRIAKEQKDQQKRDNMLARIRLGNQIIDDVTGAEFLPEDMDMIDQKKNAYGIGQGVERNFYSDEGIANILGGVNNFFADKDIQTALAKKTTYDAIVTTIEKQNKNIPGYMTGIMMDDLEQAKTSIDGLRSFRVQDYFDQGFLDNISDRVQSGEQALVEPDLANYQMVTYRTNDYTPEKIKGLFIEELRDPRNKKQAMGLRLMNPDGTLNEAEVNKNVDFLYEKFAKKIPKSAKNMTTVEAEGYGLKKPSSSGGGGGDKNASASAVDTDRTKWQESTFSDLKEPTQRTADGLALYDWMKKIGLDPWSDDAQVIARDEAREGKNFDEKSARNRLASALIKSGKVTDQSLVNNYNRLKDVIGDSYAVKAAAAVKEDDYDTFKKLFTSDQASEDTVKSLFDDMKGGGSAGSSQIDWFGDNN